MKLITLNLENFQGIKKEKFQFDGESASIYGDNATGKTTVFNAITWLLFDKDSTGAKNYTPKTKGPDGDMHHLDHAAEATFKLDGGRNISLRKVFREVYKKRRGSATEEFDGHTTDYYIDGVPSNEKEYQETLVSLSDGSAEKMMMLTMPGYFAEDMHWEDRRKILLELSGDVSDTDVINSSDELKKLNDFLLMPGTTDQHYTVDEYKKIAGTKKTEINKQLQSIPDRIDEANRAMPDIKGLDEKAVSVQIKNLKNEISKLEEERAQILNDDGAALTIKNYISEVNVQLAEARAAHVSNSNKQNETVYLAINGLKEKLLKANNQIMDIGADVGTAESGISSLSALRKKLLDEYAEIQSESWNEGEGTCPTCKRDLPAEQVEEMRNTFNLKKSERLEAINLRGQQEASKEMIAGLESDLARLKEQEAAQKKDAEDYKQQIEVLEGQIKETEPFESTQKHSRLTAEIESYRKELTSADKKHETLTAGLDEKVDALQKEINKQDELKAQIALAAIQTDRIKELEKQETELSQSYEEIEQGIYLCEVFIKTKVNLLTDKINSKFENVRFRLFIEQQNGGIREDCEVMIPSEGGRMVPFAFANNAARINAGLEIIEALSNHWNLSMPVFVDNAESVTSLVDLETQVIRLVVSEKDKQLKLDVAS